jgi:hypothetical protein
VRHDLLPLRELDLLTPAGTRDCRTAQGDPNDQVRSRNQDQRQPSGEDRQERRRQKEVGTQEEDLGRCLAFSPSRPLIHFFGCSNFLLVSRLLTLSLVLGYLRVV